MRGGWSGGGGGRCLLTLPLLGPLKPARLARAPRSRNRREEEMMEEALLPSRSSFQRTSERGNGGQGAAVLRVTSGTFPGSPGLTPRIHAWQRLWGPDPWRGTPGRPLLVQHLTPAVGGQFLDHFGDPVLQV